MKFEDFLMQRSDEQHKRLALEVEVVKLQAELDGEQALNRVLKCALQGPVSSHPCLSSMLPPQVQVLLAELAMVEEEITGLERQFEELKLSLYRERKHTKSREMQCPLQQQQRRLKQPHRLICGAGNRAVLTDVQQRTRSQHYEEFRKERVMRDRRASFGSASEIQSMFFTKFTEEIHEKSSRHTGKVRNQGYLDKELGIEKPNEISEEMIKCLIGIFLELNKASMDREGSVVVPKLTLSCMAGTSFNCKASARLFNDHTPNLDPYCILQDLDGTVRDVGAYKNFIQIIRSSVDVSRFLECFPAIGKLRVLMRKLCNVDLTFLTYKQKLAFWINIYNACIMHAFLVHGLPSTQEKLLTLMNKAVLNVGGIVLNALAIEHFILRHPTESKHVPTDEKEMLLRHAYGLGYPEPNVTFALCRGSWSSPALRVYTPDEVVNELGRAKVEYLEASVGVTSKRKIVVPKLMQWHMLDFADDMESLLEWIYSQLPRSGSLKRLMMECLNGETKCPIMKMVEIQPYESEFRYLLPM